MQLGFQLYGGSLRLWRIRRTARRPLAVKPRGMACRCVARQNTLQGIMSCTLLHIIWPNPVYIIYTVLYYETCNNELMSYLYHL